MGGKFRKRRITIARRLTMGLCGQSGGDRGSSMQKHRLSNAGIVNSRNNLAELHAGMAVGRGLKEAIPPSVIHFGGCFASPI